MAKNTGFNNITAKTITAPHIKNEPIIDNAPIKYALIILDKPEINWPTLITVLTNPRHLTIKNFLTGPYSSKN